MTQSFPGLMPSLQQLVALPSVSSKDDSLDMSNAEIIHILADWLETMGAKIELMTVTESPKKLNLIATFGSGTDGLVLSGHTDTVPYDSHIWDTDPFVLTDASDKLFGLGVTDMKCFFSLVLEVLAKFDVTKFKRPLTILATADEETTMLGAQTLANKLIEENRKLGKYALIGEPTGLKPIHLHKGIMTEHIHIVGQAGHSSNPAFGNSAIEGMHKVVSALMQWRETLQEQHKDDRFNVPMPTINFGSIHGGDNPNRICAECELKLDVRVMPSMQIENIRQTMHDIAKKSISNSGLAIHFHDRFAGLEPMETEQQSEIVALTETFSGQQSGSVGFATEGPYLNKLGCETVILGAGDIDVAHQANEYLALDRINPMMKILENLMAKLLLE